LTAVFFWAIMPAIMKLDTEKIRAGIKGKGWTIERAAKEMGISRQHLQMILKNKSTLLSRVDNIAKPLGFDPRDILTPS